MTRSKTALQIYVSRSLLRSLRSFGPVFAGLAVLLLHSQRSVAVEQDRSLSGLKQLSIEELMNVEVTSVSRRPEKLSQAASAIQVLSGEDIRRSGATRLPDALRLASNLQIAQADARSWSISSRGFSSPLANKLLVLIDGRNVYSPLFAGVFWDAQDTLLADIDRIEVISGPGGTQWGTNAVNGVINVITKTAAQTQGLWLEAAAGNSYPGMVNARYGSSFGDGLNFRVYGKYFDRDATVNASGQDANDDWHSRQGGFRLDWQATTDRLLTLQGDIYEEQYDNNAVETPVASGRNVTARWSEQISERSQWQAQVYFDRTFRDGTQFIDTLETYDLDFQHQFQLGDRHEFVWGAGYREVHDHFESGQLILVPGNVTQSWISGFVQDDIALVPEKLYLTLGTKAERNDYTGWEYQPSGKIAWRVDEQRLLWASVSRAVRTPSRLDRDFYTPPFAGGPDFESEDLLAYELGARLQVAARTVASLAAFYNDYDDLRSIELRFTPVPAFVVENLQQGEAAGAELTIDFRASDSWRLWAGYTYVDLDIRAKPGSVDQSAGSTEAADPEHQAFARAALDLPGNWQVDAAVRYVGAVDVGDVPSYTELDLRLSWEVRPGLELSIVGQNLLHERHAEFGLPSSRREIERSVYGQLRWQY